MKFIVHTSRKSRAPVRSWGLSAGYDFNSIIGYSQAIRDKINIAKQFAKSSANVLVTGESGVGKELFAQAIHNHSSRSKGPFVALNCASFPSELIESELFGYVEGAFTGASKRGQTGKIELADGGTLFLDEIGELPYYFQPKLLRVLETWTITKVGDSKPIPVDVRLVAATNRNLEKMVEEGLFRSDLYYRLQVLNVEIPHSEIEGRTSFLWLNIFWSSLHLTVKIKLKLSPMRQKDFSQTIYGPEMCEN